jgi:hypothetical protein
MDDIASQPAEGEADLESDTGGGSGLQAVAYQTAVLLLLLLIGGWVVMRARSHRDEKVEEVDGLFKELIKDRVARVIEETHEAVEQQAEDGELDLDELGPTSWDDMPCVVLVAIMDQLLQLGMEAAAAGEISDAVFAFSKALELYSQAVEGPLRHSPEPLQSVVFRLLIHRSGAHAELSNEADAAQDAKGAAEIQSWTAASAEASSEISSEAAAS